MQLIISGNDDVPDATVTHLKDIWGALSQLSTLYADVPDAPPDEAESPSKPPSQLPDRAKTLERQLWSSVLRFSLKKIRHRIRKGLSKIKEINISSLGEDDPFRAVLRFLDALEDQVFFAAKRDRLGPHSEDLRVFEEKDRRTPVEAVPQWCSPYKALHVATSTRAQKK